MISAMELGINKFLHRKPVVRGEVSPMSHPAQLAEGESPQFPVTDSEIAWDKFTRFFAPIPTSLARIPVERIRFGDVYNTTRMSGKDLTMIPMHVKEWKSQRGVSDALIVLGFNPQDQIVGMRTVYMDINGPIIAAKGAVASAICNDGIGSALEEARHRSSQELLAYYRRNGRSVREIRHTIEDDNKKVLDQLQKEAEENPDSVSLAHRYAHAVHDRPRWVSLFDSSATTRMQTGDQLHIYPDDALESGLSGGKPGALRLKKQKVEGRTLWVATKQGEEVRDVVSERGLLNKDYIVEQMHHALTTQPE